MCDEYREYLMTFLRNFHIYNPEHFYSNRFLSRGPSYERSQQELSIHIGIEGCKKQYANIVEFFVHTLFSYLEDRYEEDQFEEIAIQSKCESLSQEETVSIFEQFTAEWEEKPILHLAGKFIQAIQTFDKLNFKVIVIETEKGYIAVYWRDSIIWNGGFGFNL
jgi:hypothetical protein